MGPAVPLCFGAALVDEIGRLGPDFEVVRVDAQPIVALVAHYKPTTWDISRDSPSYQLVSLLAVTTPCDTVRLVVFAQLQAPTLSLRRSQNSTVDLRCEVVAMMQEGLRPPRVYGHADRFP